MRKRGCALFLFLIIVLPLRAADSQQTQPAGRKVWIQKSQELWVQEAGENKARRILRARPHEGFADLETSPDAQWCFVVVTYPFDILGGRHEQFHALVSLKSGKRVDVYDFQRKFGTKDSVTDFLQWVPEKDATLRILFADGSDADFDLNQARPPLPRPAAAL